jgi:hypothetical protein
MSESGTCRSDRHGLFTAEQLGPPQLGWRQLLGVVGNPTLPVTELMRAFNTPGARWRRRTQLWLPACSLQLRCLQPQSPSRRGLVRFARPSTKARRAYGSLHIALIVGTIVNAIHQGDALFGAHPLITVKALSNTSFPTASPPMVLSHSSLPIGRRELERTSVHALATKTGVPHPPRIDFGGLPLVALGGVPRRSGRRLRDGFL